MNQQRNLKKSRLPAFCVLIECVVCLVLIEHVQRFEPHVGCSQRDSAFQKCIYYFIIMMMVAVVMVIIKMVIAVIMMIIKMTVAVVMVW